VSPDTITIKGIRQGLLVTLGEEGWSPGLLALEARLDANPAFFRGGRVALDVGAQELNHSEIEDARALLARHGVDLWAVVSTNPITEAAAQELGLVIDLGLSRPRGPEAATERGGEPVVEGLVVFVLGRACVTLVTSSSSATSTLGRRWWRAVTSWCGADCAGWCMPEHWGMRGPWSVLLIWLPPNCALPDTSPALQRSDGASRYRRWPQCKKDRLWPFPGMARRWAEAGQSHLYSCPLRPVVTGGAARRGISLLAGK